MKETTGEVSMTMVTVVAISIIGVILATLWPTIQNWINQSFDGIEEGTTGGFGTTTTTTT